ncbi:DNA starvation/stationary phase protection protein [Streptomyces sp. TRM 70351]|uniref:Dps family protein n=1 Tax=Streptomyces sp. TRM 70351 TaxID=3116552 RepID=UPI002E7C4DF8|nr:DNA starvation/stationary phase protection protein [Streptomyces sp. TRM 70351]MEE1927123.1 DNA starvation/stationary phase protection protein [Streptomyces sp. TRM 70351]
MPDTSPTPQYTVPGLSPEAGGDIIRLLRGRLHALNDLALTLKHVHWNVVGPHFIAVHEMLDPQVDSVRGMIDTTAERIATLGGSPPGTPGVLVAERTWDDYGVGRAGAIEHLGALDVVYTGVIEDHRRAMEAADDIDLVTQDMLIEHLRDLELFQWFVRAHLENAGGSLSTGGAGTEQDAAARAADRARQEP